MVRNLHKWLVFNRMAAILRTLIPPFCCAEIGVFSPTSLKTKRKQAVKGVQNNLVGGKDRDIYPLRSLLLFRLSTVGGLCLQMF